MKIAPLFRKVCVSLAVIGFAGTAAAQAYPSKPIKLMVGFGPGGGGDNVARLYALKLQEVLNTPVIVENKPGASQLLAIRPLMAAPADGYTLVLTSGSALAQGPGIRKDLPYDPLKDFSLVSMMATQPGVFLVNPSLPVRTMPELIAYAKANPGKLNFGSAGLGAANHLQMEYLMSKTGTSMVHVPFKNDGEVAREVASGTLQVSLASAQNTIPLTLDNRVRAIGVAGSKRLTAIPNVPLLSEGGVAELKDIESYTWFAVVGPAGMPAAIVNRLNEAINQVSAMPDVATRMREGLFCDPVIGTPSDFRSFLEKDLARWRELGKTVKI